MPVRKRDWKRTQEVPRRTTSQQCKVGEQRSIDPRNLEATPLEIKKIKSEVFAVINVDINKKTRSYQATGLGEIHKENALEVEVIGDYVKKEELEDFNHNTFHQKKNELRYQRLQTKSVVQDRPLNVQEWDCP